MMLQLPFKINFDNSTKLMCRSRWDIAYADLCDPSDLRNLKG